MNNHTIYKDKSYYTHGQIRYYVDQNGNEIDSFFIINAHLITKESVELFKRLIDENHKFVCMSSRTDFPRASRFRQNGKEPWWVSAIEEKSSGYMHCFRNPQDFRIPQNKPQILLSNSDYWNFPKMEKLNKKYHFMYCCNRGSWGKEDPKNEKFFVKFAKRFCVNSNMKCCIAGRDSFIDEFPVLKHENIHFFGDSKWSKVLELQRQSGCLFVTAVEDASPRIIPEAILMGTPVVVNKDIWGGWKYVNDETGLFFDESGDIDLVAEAILEMNDSNLNPREFFVQNYGKKRTGIRMADFIRNETDIDLPKHVKGLFRSSQIALGKDHF